MTNMFQCLTGNCHAILKDYFGEHQSQIFYGRLHIHCSRNTDLPSDLDIGLGQPVPADFSELSSTDSITILCVPLYFFRRHCSTLNSAYRSTEDRKRLTSENTIIPQSDKQHTSNNERDDNSNDGDGNTLLDLATVRVYYPVTCMASANDLKVSSDMKKRVHLAPHPHELVAYADLITLPVDELAVRILRGLNSVNSLINCSLLLPKALCSDSSTSDESELTITSKTQQPEQQQQQDKSQPSTDIKSDASDDKGSPRFWIIRESVYNRIRALNRIASEKMMTPRLFWFLALTSGTQSITNPTESSHDDNQNNNDNSSDLTTKSSFKLPPNLTTNHFDPFAISDSYLKNWIGISPTPLVRKLQFRQPTTNGKLDTTINVDGISLVTGETFFKKICAPLSNFWDGSIRAVFIRRESLDCGNAIDPNLRTGKYAHAKFRRTRLRGTDYLAIKLKRHSNDDFVKDDDFQSPIKSFNRISTNGLTKRSRPNKTKTLCILTSPTPLSNRLSSTSTLLSDSRLLSPTSILNSSIASRVKWSAEYMANSNGSMSFQSDLGTSSCSNSDACPKLNTDDLDTLLLKPRPRIPPKRLDLANQDLEIALQRSLIDHTMNNSSLKKSKPVTYLARLNKKLVPESDSPNLINHRPKSLLKHGQKRRRKGTTLKIRHRRTLRTKVEITVHKSPESVETMSELPDQECAISQPLTSKPNGIHEIKSVPVSEPIKSTPAGLNESDAHQPLPKLTLAKSSDGLFNVIDRDTMHSIQSNSDYSNSTNRRDALASVVLHSVDKFAKSTIQPSESMRTVKKRYVRNSDSASYENQIYCPKQTKCMSNDDKLPIKSESDDLDAGSNLNSVEVKVEMDHPKPDQNCYHHRQQQQQQQRSPQPQPKNSSSKYCDTNSSTNMPLNLSIHNSSNDGPTHVGNVAVNLKNGISTLGFNSTDSTKIPRNDHLTTAISLESSSINRINPAVTCTSNLEKLYQSVNSNFRSNAEPVTMWSRLSYPLPAPDPPRLPIQPQPQPQPQPNRILPHSSVNVAISTPSGILPPMIPVSFGTSTTTNLFEHESNFGLPSFGMNRSSNTTTYVIPSTIHFETDLPASSLTHQITAPTHYSSNRSLVPLTSHHYHSHTHSHPQSHPHPHPHPHPHHDHDRNHHSHHSVQNSSSTKPVGYEPPLKPIPHYPILNNHSSMSLDHDFSFEPKLPPCPTVVAPILPSLPPPPQQQQQLHRNSQIQPPFQPPSLTPMHHTSQPMMPSIWSTSPTQQPSIGPTTMQISQPNLGDLSNCSLIPNSFVPYPCFGPITQLPLMNPDPTIGSSLGCTTNSILNPTNLVQFTVNPDPNLYGSPLLVGTQTSWFPSLL